MPALVVLILAATLVPAPASAAPADDIAGLLNQARWANGQAGLIRNPAMDQVAADWAAQMAASGTMSHNPDYSTQIPGGWSAAAENVAQGYPTATAMHDGWMGSPGHRANILGDYTDVGIAFLSAGGTTWGVEVFARYPGHVGPANPAPPPPPAPQPAPTETVETLAAPTPTPTPDPTPSATSTSDGSGSRETVSAEGEDARAAAAGWWIGLVIGVVAMAAGGFWAVRRRRLAGRRPRHGRRAER
jgi:hypothetical protein